MEHPVPGIIDAEMYSELQKLQNEVFRLEEAAAKKDKHISQLTSRMREYEMGEYSLVEAVSEIKSCRKIIRTKDREIEVLTDEINSLKLQLSEAIEKNKSPTSSSREVTSFLNHDQCFRHKRIKHKTKVNQLNKTSQCRMSVIPDQYLEDIYTTQVQNEMLRLELSTICEKSIAISKQMENINMQDEIKHGKSYDETIKDLPNLGKTEKNTFTVNCSDECLHDNNLTSVEACYQVLLPHMENADQYNQDILCDMMRLINVLKNNQMVLIRRYMLLSDQESSVRQENIKLRKVIHVNYRGSDSSAFVDLTSYQAMIEKYANSDGLILTENEKQINGICKDSSCQVNLRKLKNLTVRLQSEISMLQKLLEISHHQTQAVEAMWFTQKIEMKDLREQFAFLQAQSDEKMLLGKLTMKVLQLQFNQAACIYELKKYKLNEQALQDWHAALKEEYEENGKKFAALYLEAQDKAKHLHEVLKELCHRSNEALSSYLKTNTCYKT